MKLDARNTKAGRGGDAVTVGWMGVTLEAPEGWSPVSVSGEGTNGYLKVVSPDTRYLEVKWEQPKGAVSVPAALERYFAGLRRSARKARREIRIKTRPRGFTGIRPQKQAPIPYSWEADRKALGCIWHCGECNRLVIAELVGEPDDDLSPAGPILRGLRDHGEEAPLADGKAAGKAGERWNTWALYGLCLPAPAAYRMEKQTLMTGHQRFLLKCGGASIAADRWGLAEIALRGTGLREWYEGREGATLGRYAYRVEEVELNGHPAFRLVGRARVLYGLGKLFMSLTALIWPRFFFRGYLWQCPETNRIYAVVGEQPRKGRLIDEIVGRMRCHGGTGD